MLRYKSALIKHQNNKKLNSISSNFGIQNSLKFSYKYNYNSLQNRSILSFSQLPITNQQHINSFKEGYSLEAFRNHGLISNKNSNKQKFNHQLRTNTTTTSNNSSSKENEISKNHSNETAVGILDVKKSKKWFRRQKRKYQIIYSSILLSFIALVLLIYTLLFGEKNEQDKNQYIAPPLMMELLKKLPFRVIAQIWGAINNVPIPESLRPSVYSAYARALGIDLEEVDLPLKEYQSLQEFFARQLKENLRPIEDDKTKMASPADGTILSVGEINNGKLEQIKGITYPFAELLRHTENGEISLPKPSHPNNKIYYYVIYLGPGDYHRFHSPYDWHVDTVRHVTGQLFPVAPWFLRRVPNVFALNERVVLSGTWSEGRCWYVPIGASGVGTININMKPQLKTNRSFPQALVHRHEYRKINRDRVADHLAWGPSYPYPADHVPVTKGEEIGHFRMGSSVVVAFESSGFQFNVEPNQHIKCGQNIGQIIPTQVAPEPIPDHQQQYGVSPNQAKSRRARQSKKQRKRQQHEKQPDPRQANSPSLSSGRLQRVEQKDLSENKLVNIKPTFRKAE
eukprot:gb/GECH01001280.1/.p1 GENE.gb/GECH01001280.1/~~gb/GECH01001280.1/.p1  ORF type:complete len:568 (+),score=139.28 gb/GECH01001280.1/:1-1704(+)